MGVSKNNGNYPKMDGENHGKPYFLMDDLGGKIPLFLVQHPVPGNKLVPKKSATQSGSQRFHNLTASIFQGNHWNNVFVREICVASTNHFLGGNTFGEVMCK